MSEEEQEVNYREEVLRLVAEGEIKHTTKYVKKASDETVEKIYKNYLTNNWTRPTTTSPTRSSNNFAS